jgi:hypothetical protein
VVTQRMPVLHLQLESEEESPELYFNVACALAESGEPALALRALGLGIAAGEASLAADGADSAAVAETLAPLRAQARSSSRPRS